MREFIRCLEIDTVFKAEHVPMPPPGPLPPGPPPIPLPPDPAVTAESRLPALYTS